MAVQGMKRVGWMAALVLPVLVGCASSGFLSVQNPIPKSEDAKGMLNGEGWVDASGKANPEKWRVDSRACTDDYNAYSVDQTSKGSFNGYFLLCMGKKGWRS
jgi:hypothetical protein